MNAAVDTAATLDLRSTRGDLARLSTPELLTLCDQLYRKLDTTDPALEVWDQYDDLTAELDRRTTGEPVQEHRLGVAHADGPE